MQYGPRGVRGGTSTVEFPDRRFRRLPRGAQWHQGNPIAPVALGLQQVEPAVDRLADCGLRLGIAGRGRCRTTGPHDCVPCFAFQPVGLAQLGFRSASDQDRFPIGAFVDPMRVSDTLRLRLAVPA